MTETPRNILPQPVKKTRRTNYFGFLKIIPYLFLFGVIIVCGAVYVPGPLKEDTTVIVPHGAGPREVAALLESKNAVFCPFLFRVAAKYLTSNALKAGEYELPAGVSTLQVLYMIHDGHSVVRLFTVAEGLTSAEVAQMLNDEPTLVGDKIASIPDGSLLPETYRYMYGDNRESIVTRMQKSMQDELNAAWEKRDPNLNFITSKEQAVVLASIVEKETAKPEERSRIAGVFYNRLRHNMRLQSDPTVIYAITKARGSMDHDIDHDDLSFSSPYNTYTNDGLPPGPICNPGKASIEAVLNPEWNEYLYFVANGLGGHAFAKTLAEHNQNVAHWNQLQGK